MCMPATHFCLFVSHRVFHDTSIVQTSPLLPILATTTKIAPTPQPRLTADDALCRKDVKSWNWEAPGVGQKIEWLQNPSKTVLTALTCGFKGQMVYFSSRFCSPFSCSLFVFSACRYLFFSHPFACLILFEFKLRSLWFIFLDIRPSALY